jgi:hypothetical protein
MVKNTGDLGSLPWRAQLLRVYKRSRHKGPINQRRDSSNQAQNASEAHGRRYGAAHWCRLVALLPTMPTGHSSILHVPRLPGTPKLKAKYVARGFPVYRQLAPHARCKSVENRDVCE